VEGRFGHLTALTASSQLTDAAPRGGIGVSGTRHSLLRHIVERCPAFNEAMFALTGSLFRLRDGAYVADTQPAAEPARVASTPQLASSRNA
jgi:hypothetical protein